MGDNIIKFADEFNSSEYGSEDILRFLQIPKSIEYAGTSIKFFKFNQVVHLQEILRT